VSGGRRYGPRSFAGRVLSILGSFTNGQARLTLVEISRRTGLASSTTHRLVTELSAWGAPVRDPDLRYRIGPRLQELTTVLAGLDPSVHHRGAAVLETPTEEGLGS
jgi:DNA-binding IclR family transcriptional regulator